MVSKRKKCFSKNLLVLVLITFFQKSIGVERSCSFTFPLSSDPEEFSQVVINYDDGSYACIKCLNGNTNLVSKKLSSYEEKVCGSMNCNGVICGSKSKCTPINQIKLKIHTASILHICQGGRILGTRPTDPTPTTVTTQVPLIVGFAVGGIMLAVVIAGVFLGRANRTASQTESGDVTTPVSMSYSEWISNYSTGGRGSKVSNMRVQETGNVADDQQGLAVYSIVYGDDDATSGEAMRVSNEEATVIEVDGMVPFEEPNQYTVYQTSDDVMDYVTAPLYDGDEAVRFEWTDDYLPYEYLAQHETKSIASSQEASLNYSMTDNNLNLYRDDDTNRVAPSLDDSSVYSRGRDTCWSDETSYDQSSLRTSVKRHSPVNPNNESCLHEIRDQTLVDTSNTAHLKHVFVDVHRSMTCSCEDLRASQLILDSNNENPNVLFRHHGVTKQKSFLAFRSHYNQKDRNQSPANVEDVQFLPLPPTRDGFSRRYSV